MNVNIFIEVDSLFLYYVGRLLIFFQQDLSMFCNNSI